jgi:DNA-binding response OmpR family regulator
MHVLVVEDNPAISHFLVKGLREQRFLVDLVEDGAAAEAQALSESYDAILLDLMLPGLDGLTLCRRLREQGVDTPILVVTARDEVADRVAGLDSGADDYITKPFDFSELLARLRAVVRRGRTRHLDAVLRYGPIVLDPRAQRVTVDGAPVELTATEYRLLQFLMRRADAIVSRDLLVEHVWGTEYDPDSNVVEVYVSYLRRKLQGTSAEGIIRTVRGLGYTLGAGEAGA